MKGTPILIRKPTPILGNLSSLSFLSERNRLRHQSGHGRSPRRPPFLLVLFAEESHIQSPPISAAAAILIPTNHSLWTCPSSIRVQPNDPQHAPAQFRLKKASSVGAVCGNDSSFINITDHSVTDGINLEHKQEQRQSAKDAGSTRRCRQQTSWDSRSNASQHERSGSTPPRQSTLNRRVRTTHQTGATSEGDTTDPGGT